MARPKGSKNKPKYSLEVVAPCTEMEDFVIKDTPLKSEKEDNANNIPTVAKNAQVDTQIPDDTTSESVKKKRHRRTKAEMEAYRASLKAQSTIPSEFDPEILLKNNLFINKNDSKIVSDLQVGISTRVESEAEINQEKRINNLKTSEEPETQENQGVSETSKKKSKQTKPKTAYPLCDCCQQEIYCQPHRIDTNMISAQVADYHRESPRWVNLCSSCAKKLSDTVDKWLQDNGCITRMEQRILEKQREKENG